MRLVLAGIDISAENIQRRQWKWDMDGECTRADWMTHLRYRLHLQRVQLLIHLFSCLFLFLSLFKQLINEKRQPCNQVGCAQNGVKVLVMGTPKNN